jgi:hypothetical protein
MSRPSISVTRFWMRNDTAGQIEVLIEHEGKWLVVFGKDGPGPVARDDEQTIDHMIHAGGINNLLEHGRVHGDGPVADKDRWTPSNGPTIQEWKGGRVFARKPRKADRRQGKRRQDDKTKARLKK